MKKGKTFTIQSIEDTKKFASKLAKSLKGGEVIALVGELGAGKTYFTKFIAEALGVDPADVTSPTYIYWRQYKGKKLKINHFDMYRIESEKEVDSLGLEEALTEDNSITVIEWADKVREVIPEDAIWIEIVNLGKGKREILIKNEKLRNKKG